MTRDIRDTIHRTAYEASRLVGDSEAELREWAGGCRGLTMNHLDLHRAKLDVDRAYDAIGRIKADIDLACTVADEATKKGIAA